MKGTRPLVKSANREVVTALREIADNQVRFERKQVPALEEKEIPYQLSNFAP